MGELYVVVVLCVFSLSVLAFCCGLATGSPVCRICQKGIALLSTPLQLPRLRATDPITRGFTKSLRLRPFHSTVLAHVIPIRR